MTTVDSRAARPGIGPDPTGQRGASLIEIVVATMILSIVALGMVEFFASGRVGFNREENKRVATLLAQEALERTASMPYDQIGPWTETRTIESVDYTVAVITQAGVPERDMATLRCTIAWNATPTVRKNITLTTMVYDL